MNLLYLIPMCVATCVGCMDLSGDSGGPLFLITDADKVLIRHREKPGELVFIKILAADAPVELGSRRRSVMHPEEESYGYSPSGNFWIGARELPVSVWMWCADVPFVDMRTKDPKWLDENKPINLLSLQMAEEWTDRFNELLARSGLHYVSEVPFETDWEYAGKVLFGNDPEMAKFIHVGESDHSFNISLINTPSMQYNGTYDFIGGLEEIARFMPRSPEDKSRNMLKINNTETVELRAVRKGGSVIDLVEDSNLSRRVFISETLSIPEAGLRLLLRASPE